MTVYETKQVTAKTKSEDTALLFEKGLQSVEDVMLSVVNSSVSILSDTSRHILAAGGKRVRPRVLLLAYLTAGGRDVEAVAPVAGAVELMHTASVVHDDINDHGVVRRGRPSINAIWGRTFALLTGDYMFTKVYELMAPFKDLNLILAQAATALVEGETLQAQAVKESNFTREVYSRIIALKTAALFKAAAALGGELAGATKVQIEALGEYGYNIGLAFQIVDDILDIVGDEEQLGKTAGIDLEQGRGFAAAYEDGNKPDEPVDDLMESIKRKMLNGEALEKARQQSQMLIQMAIRALDVFPDSESKDAMIQLATEVIDRDY